jgi:hypothetical protein
MVKKPDLKVGDFVLVPQHKVIRSRWPMARITKIIPDSTYGGIKSAMIETYVKDGINVKKRNELFKRKKTSELTDAELRQVTGFFRPCEKAVLLEKLCPYEIYETDARFDVPITIEKLPLNFPGHSEIDETDLSQPAHKSDTRSLQREKKKNQRREMARQKRPRDPVLRDNSAKRSRRENVDYQRHYKDLIDGGLR